MAAEFSTYQGLLDRILWMEAAQRKHDTAAMSDLALSVRVASNGYWAVMAAASFAAALSFRLQHDYVALALAALALVVCPVAALTDRVRFDGKKLWRSGLFAFLTRAVALPLSEIEWVETLALRSLRSGDRVYYRYRCEVTGNGQAFVFVSGGMAFRRMVRALFAVVDEAKLDARSVELRDHLVEPTTLEQTLSRLSLASEDLLKATARQTRKGRGAAWRRVGAAPAEETARGQLLRRAANELYVLGRLSEAAEAFRRALRALPGDAWLIYEFARFLHSQAGATRDLGLRRRGQAALRLAARRSEGDAALLARLGESFLEYGDPARAEKMFRLALANNPEAFRAATGLAEIGLMRGQLAHVLHHYNTAAACAHDEALARLAKRESEYYNDLNNNEDYLEVELTRLNWLEHVARGRSRALKVMVWATIGALTLPAFFVNIGPYCWSFAGSAWLIWFVAVACEKLLAGRTMPDEEDED